MNDEEKQDLDKDGATKTADEDKSSDSLGGSPN